MAALNPKHFCPRCGAENVDRGAFCAACGNALGPAAGAPGAGVAALPLPPPPLPPAPPVLIPASTPRRRSTGRKVAIVVGVLFIVLLLLLFVGYLASNDGAIDLTGVNYQMNTTGGTCWSSQTGSGGTFAGDSQATVSEVFDGSYGSQYGYCTVTGATMLTQGFKVVSTNAPFNVDFGASETLTVVFTTPSSYTGVLTVEVNATCNGSGEWCA